MGAGYVGAAGEGAAGGMWGIWAGAGGVAGAAAAGDGLASIARTCANTRHKSKTTLWGRCLCRMLHAIDSEARSNGM